MSGRRAKQRRRLVWKAAAGDLQAMAMTSDLTPRKADRITARHIATEARHAGRHEVCEPVHWNPAAADKARAAEHRHRERGPPLTSHGGTVGRQWRALSADPMTPLPPWAVAVFFVVVALTFLALGLLAATRGLM